MNDEYVTETCKPGTHECCAYLTMGAGGWECAKNSSMRFHIDLRLAEGTMRAVGNNCEGWTEEVTDDIKS